jgi:nitroreductase
MPKKMLTRRHVLQGIGTAALLSQAYDLAHAIEQGEPLSFASVVKRRGMIRKYEDKPVSDEAVKKLLQYAVRAPSAGNLQPWEFVIVRDPDVRAKLAKAAMNQNSVATAPIIIATCADTQRMGEKYGTRGSFYSLVDTSFASLLILLGATEQGLGACFVGSYNSAEVANIFQLPNHVRPVGLITIGYPDEQPRKPSNPKIPLEKLVHENTW